MNRSPRRSLVHSLPSRLVDFVWRRWTLPAQQIRVEQERIFADLDAGRSAEAEAAARDLLNRVERRYKPHSIEAAGATEVLAHVLCMIGKGNEPATAAWSELAVDRWRRQLGENHPRVGAALSRWACVLAHLDDRTRAREAWLQAIPLLRPERDPNSQRILADTYFNLGKLELEEERWSSAGEQFAQAVAIREAAVEPDPLELADALLHLAAAQREIGDHIRGEGAARRSVEIFEMYPEQETRRLGFAYQIHGLLLFHLGRLDEAELQLQRVDPLLPAEPGRAGSVPALDALSLLAGRRGQIREAIEIAATAVARLRHSGESRALAHGLIRLSLLEEACGETRSALAQFEEAHRLLAAELATDSLELVGAEERLAAMMERNGRPAKARHYYESAIQKRERTLGPEDASLAEPLFRLAELTAREGLFGPAQGLMLRLLKLEERTLGPHHPETMARLNQLAILLAKEGDDDGALKLFDTALTRLEKASTHHPPTVAAIVSNISALLKRAGDERGLKELFERAVELQERASQQKPFPQA